MTEQLRVGASGVVRGCLPRNCSLAARFDRTTGIIHISSLSLELHSFSINVNVMNVLQHISREPIKVVVFEREARLFAKYESGILRYDSPDIPELWLEVNIEQMLKYVKMYVKTFSSMLPTDDAAGTAAARLKHNITNWPHDRTLELVRTIEVYGAIRNGVFVPCQSVPNFDKRGDDLYREPFTCKDMTGTTAQYTLQDMDRIYAVKRNPPGPDMVPPRPYYALGQEMQLDDAYNIGYELKNTVMDSVMCSDSSVSYDKQRHRIEAIYFKLK